MKGLNPIYKMKFILKTFMQKRHLTARRSITAFH